MAAATGAAPRARRRPPRASRPRSQSATGAGTADRGRSRRRPPPRPPPRPPRLQPARGHAVRRRDHRRRAGQRARPGAARGPDQAGVGLQPERRLARRRARPGAADAGHRRRPRRHERARPGAVDQRRRQVPQAAARRLRRRRRQGARRVQRRPGRGASASAASRPYAETQNYVRIVQANAAAYRDRIRTRPPPLRPTAVQRSLRDLRPMTTDRTAAPPRATALAERCPRRGPKAGSAGGRVLRPAAAPSRPRTDEAPRNAATSAATTHRATERARQRDDVPPRPPRSRRPRRPPRRPTPEEPRSSRADAPSTPNLFALQLAGPLPPAATAGAGADREPRRDDAGAARVRAGPGPVADHRPPCRPPTARHARRRAAADRARHPGAVRCPCSAA